VSTERLTNINDDFSNAVLEHSGLLRVFSAFAIAGQVIFLASAWLLPAVSEFSLMGDYISELALGRYGFVQIAAFTISGLGLLALAYTLGKLTTNSWGNLIGSVLIAVYGVGSIVVAIFPTDRIESAADIWNQSTTGLVHASTALIGSLSILLAMFILSWKFRKDPRWRSLVIWSALLFCGAFSLLFAQSEGPRVGLMQRLLTTLISGWLIMIAFRARSIAASAKENN